MAPRATLGSLAGRFPARQGRPSARGGQPCATWHGRVDSWKGRDAALLEGIGGQMGDWSLLVALVLGMLGVLAYTKLRARPAAPPRCTACDIEMEYDSQMLDPMFTNSRYAAGMGFRAEGAEPSVRLYHCPRCGRRQQVR
jgi:hypothetical protein